MNRGRGFREDIGGEGNGVEYDQNIYLHVWSSQTTKINIEVNIFFKLWRSMKFLWMAIFL